MGAKVGNADGPEGDLNLTPLIDIVLVILIIMMVNIPIQIEEMGVKLPGSQVSQRNDSPPADQLVVAVYENGDLALNRRLMTEEVLFYEVTRRLRPMSKKNVFIDAAAGIDYGRVVDMVDLAREAGAAKVGLARMKDSGPAEATSVAPGAMPRGVILGSPKVVGALSEKKADAAIRKLLPTFRACYDKALAASPGLSGRLTVRATVGPMGEHMSEPKIQGGATLEDDALKACVEAVLPNLAFEPLGEQKTAVALFPVLFSPG
jgi:biopolymer transport protein ExbD